MKKLAFLISLVLVFSISLVYATELQTEPNPTSDVVSGEVVSDIETISGEETDTTALPVSGEETDTTNEVTPEINTPNEDTVENGAVKSNNSATIGAIIAIVIVVAVVAVAAVLRKD